MPRPNVEAPPGINEWEATTSCAATSLIRLHSFGVPSDSSEFKGFYPACFALKSLSGNNFSPQLSAPHWPYDCTRYMRVFHPTHGGTASTFNKDSHQKGHFMKTVPIALLLCVAASLPASAQNKIDDRMNESAEVLSQLLARPDAIPKSLLNRSVCVLVFPTVKKVGVGLGVTYGRGVIVCRSGTDMSGPWSAPAMYKLNVGSLGVQLGSSSTDFVLLLENKRTAVKVLSGKLKLGADATAVAGPTGAKAVGANDENIDILTYSRAKGGLFAGASLGSASMETDDSANKSVYGKDISATEIVMQGGATPTAAGEAIVKTLEKASPTRSH